MKQFDFNNLIITEGHLIVKKSQKGVKSVATIKHSSLMNWSEDYGPEYAAIFILEVLSIWNDDLEGWLVFCQSRNRGKKPAVAQLALNDVQTIRTADDELGIIYNLLKMRKKKIII